MRTKNKQSKGYANEGRNGTNMYYLEQEKKVHTLIKVALKYKRWNYINSHYPKNKN